MIVCELWNCETKAGVQDQSCFLACGAKTKKKYLKQEVWGLTDKPEETEALETEMVGAPEFFLWLLAAFFSLSLECKLATLSAPSGCEQTQKTHTQAVKITI